MITEGNYKTPMEFLTSVQAVSRGDRPLPFTTESDYRRMWRLVRDSLAINSWKLFAQPGFWQYTIDKFTRSFLGERVPDLLHGNLSWPDVSCEHTHGNSNPMQMAYDELTTLLPLFKNKYRDGLARAVAPSVTSHKLLLHSTDVGNNPIQVRQLVGDAENVDRVVMLTTKGSPTDITAGSTILNGAHTLLLEEEIHAPGVPVLVFRIFAVTNTHLWRGGVLRHYRDQTHVRTPDNFTLLTHGSAALSMGVYCTRYKARVNCEYVPLGGAYMLGYPELMERGMDTYNPMHAFIIGIAFVRFLTTSGVRPLLSNALWTLGDGDKLGSIVEPMFSNYARFTADNRVLEKVVSILLPRTLRYE